MKATIELPLQFATNMLGKLDRKIVKRIQRYLKNPTFDKWDDISGIIISNKGKMKTIWNAVIEIDPFFPRYGRKTNMAGDVIREWDYIPTAEDVHKAITRVVFEGITTSN